MKNAVFADIKYMAVHDGPGLRTTLFLKGCPLACSWCHNPECIGFAPEMIFRDIRCTGCGRCVKSCPNEAHQFNAAGTHIFRRENCTACGACVEACYSDALQLCGKELSPVTASELLLEDVDFYRNSNGGVTISGGEPLCQPEFCAELFSILKVRGIHTAVDTSGFAPWTAFEKVLSTTDLFLYDLKHIDPEQHQRLTGKSNALILDNLVRLSKTGTPIEIRMPIIPGLNMTKDAVDATGKFLAALRNITRVKLLAYHPYAQDKYRHVGRNSAMLDVSPPCAEDIDRIEAELRSHGLQVG